MRQSYVIAIIVLVVALLWMAPAILRSDKEQAKSVKSQDVTMRVTVTRLVPERMLQRVEVNGQTNSSRVVELRARTRGRFAKIFLDRGARVEEGQLIAQMDIDDRQVRLDRAEAIFQQRTTEYDVSKGLRNKGFNSKVKLETARANLKIALADVKQMALDLSYTSFKAPFAGVLEERDVEVGTYIREGEIAATIVDLDPMDVTAFVAERHMGLIKLGTKAEVTLMDGSMIIGLVHYIATVANTKTRTFRVDVRIDNADYEISSGLTARVAFMLPEHMAHRIPLSALVLDDKGVMGVKIAEKQIDEDIERWKVRFVPVSLLQEEIKSVWVSGLNGDVRLIVVGHEFVMDGQIVVPVEKKDKAE